MMNFGTQFVAPTGYQQLRPAQTYYFAGRYGDRVLIVWFSKPASVPQGEDKPKRKVRSKAPNVGQPKAWRVHAMHMTAVDFELGLKASGEASALIQSLEQQAAVPPWLIEEIEKVRAAAGEEDTTKANQGASSAMVEANHAARHRTPPSQNAAVRVDRRYQRVLPAVRQQNRILSDRRPLSLLVKICNEHGIREHGHRLQLWFFAVVLHPGIGKWALKKPHGMTGKWSRTTGRHAKIKYGRKSLSNPKGGYPTAEIRDAILRAYARHVALKRSMRKIYDNAIVDDFKCQSIPDGFGGYDFYQPDGKPFPTFSQFRSVVIKKYGLDVVRRKKHGDEYVDNHREAYVGSFKDDGINLLEDVQADAYQVDDRPRSVDEYEEIPALIVVRIKCTTSSAAIGVGFSLEGEDSDAYGSAMFCAAVPKELIAWLYGLNRGHIRWEMKGVPPDALIDRGAGGSGFLESLERRFPVRGLTPSYAPRLKAAVEASNPKSATVEGAPRYWVSDLTLPKMMKREILETISQNHQTNIIDRLTDEEVIEFERRGWPATPDRFWALREEQMRTVARQVSVEDAVRRFLRPCSCVVTKSGVKYLDHVYSSPNLVEVMQTGQIAPTQNVTVYSLSLVRTAIWVEIKGEIFMLTPLLRHITSSSEVFASVLDQPAVEKKRARLSSRTRQSADAARNKARNDLRASTGKSWDGGRLKRGSPKKPKGLLAEEVKVTAAKERARPPRSSKSGRRPVRKPRS